MSLMTRHWWLDERLMLILSGALLVLDQALKALFSWARPVVDLGFVRFQFVRNTGASFGILQGQNALLVWVSIIALGAFMFFFDRLEPQYRGWGFMVMAGVLSNMADRALRGAVVDYVNLGWFPVFNIADALIVVGIMSIAVLVWRDDAEGRGEGKKKSS